MLWLIAALLAAILITLLGAWGVVSRTLAVLIGLVLWILVAGLAGHHLGTPALWVVVGLPFAVIFIGGMALWALGYVDFWGNPTDPASRKPPEKPPPHDPDWELKAEQARRAELGALRKAIEDRSQQC